MNSDGKSTPSSGTFPDDRATDTLTLDPVRLSVGIGRSGQAPFHVSVTGLETADEKLVLLKAFGVDLESADAKAVLDGSVDTFTHAWQADGTPFALATANIALFTRM